MPHWMDGAQRDHGGVGTKEAGGLHACHIIILVLLSPMYVHMCPSQRYPQIILGTSACRRRIMSKLTCCLWRA